jgi:hypothetical protein
MSDIKCYYHKNRTAVDKCEECGKYLCVECKQNISHAHTRSSGKTSSTYYTHHILCPDCAVQDIGKQNNPIGGVFTCLIFIIFVIVVTSVSSSDGFGIPPFFIGWLAFMGIILLCSMLYKFAIKAPEEKKKAVEIQKKAHQALKISKDDEKKDDEVKKEQIALYCKFCGAPIDENSQSCKFCGMNWVWK